MAQTENATTIQYSAAKYGREQERRGEERDRAEANLVLVPREQEPEEENEHEADERDQVAPLALLGDVPAHHQRAHRVAEREHAPAHARTWHEC